jgi:carbonic anhydrase/acetyltransferase-like protein (isoleucine patch superfamily)
MPAIATGGKSPRIHPSVFVADGAFVIGDVELAEDASVWFHAVLRGDINSIVIGERTNIQDGCVFHVTNHHSVRVGSDVTVGHGAIVHGCTVEDGSLIGMRAVVLDNAKVGTGSLVAAGAVVLENMVIPPGSLVAGVPARVLRGLTPEEQKKLLESASHYVEYAKSFRAAPKSSRLA